MSEDAGITIADSRPRCWSLEQEATLLLGGSSEDNLFQISDVESELDELVEAGGNYVRCTMSSREEFAVWPFEKTEEGFDLDGWNDEYWDRFETFLAACEARDVVAQLEVWATFDFYMDNWRVNPFNPACNVTYGTEESGLSPDVGDSAPHREGHNDFFYSPPAAKDLEVVRQYQERYVEKLLEISLEYDTVLYCIDNETDVTPAWPDYWARFIKEYAAEEGETAYVTEMWLNTDIRDAAHDNVVEQPGLYDFVEISQNNQTDGPEHYERALWMYERLDPPRPLNNVKIYGSDAVGWTGGTREGVERFWRNLFAGCAAVRFHRPDSGQGLNDRAKYSIRAARELSDAVPFIDGGPLSDVLVDADAEAYVLASDESAAVYFPDGEPVTLVVDQLPEVNEVDWYDLKTVSWAESGSIDTSGQIGLTPPDHGRWVAVLH